MMEQSSRKEVWKVDIGERVELDSVESVLAEAMKDVIKEGDPEGPHGELERVELREKQTTVFMTGNEKTAKAFSNSLGKRLPRAKVTTAKILPAEIMRFE